MSLPHWQYFLSIESDLDDCSRYVEFAKPNYKTYSVQFARIIMAAASEFDTVAKLLCQHIYPDYSSCKNKNIQSYFTTINSKYPNFTQHETMIPLYGLECKPWDGWNATISPDWWSKGYNQIKHQRDMHFDQANLENAIYAVCGLLTGLLYFYEAKYNGISNIQLESFQMPKLLSPKDYSNDSLEPASIHYTFTLPN